MPNVIACAFGLHPDTLELLADDEGVGRFEACEACSEWASRCAVLQVELAESRMDTERYKNEVENLLQTCSISRH